MMTEGASGEWRHLLRLQKRVQRKRRRKSVGPDIIAERRTEKDDELVVLLPLAEMLFWDCLTRDVGRKLGITSGEE